MLMKKVWKIADNIVSPLGWSSEENCTAALEGRSGVRPHEDELAEPYMASLLDREAVRKRAEDEGIDCRQFTFFELICILSATLALKSLRCRGIDLTKTQLILSTTKGNIALAPAGGDRMYLARSARIISEHFGLGLPPVVISNACISGVCAEMEAMRRIRAGLCDYALVIGAEEQSRFIVSGFQSFKALSPEPCRPFDAQRRGLNLGEAAATVILTSAEHIPAGNACSGESRCWELVDGAVRNDANHISGPSRTGEGSYRALRYVLDSPEWGGEDIAGSLAVVNAHGTATAYNDEMESIAIERAGLSEVPLNSLKGYFGHTMGAAGVLESIMSMHSVEKGILLPTLGFESSGVSRPVNVSSRLRSTDKTSFIKLISGFGGCNAALGFRLGVPAGRDETGRDETGRAGFESIASVTVSPEDNLEEEYRRLGCAYPKFFKMDRLCKCGFIAAEKLLGCLKDGDGKPRYDGFGDRCAIVLMNRSSSLCNDLHYLDSIRDREHYYPSPALFVYTLPNIVTGEIAIRHKIYGESIFYISDAKEVRAMSEEARIALQDNEMEWLICGWTECGEDGRCEAEVKLLHRRSNREIL